MTTNDVLDALEIVITSIRVPFGYPALTKAIARMREIIDEQREKTRKPKEAYDTIPEVTETLHYLVTSAYQETSEGPDGSRVLPYRWLQQFLADYIYGDLDAPHGASIDQQRKKAFDDQRRKKALDYCDEIEQREKGAPAATISAIQRHEKSIRNLTGLLANALLEASRDEPTTYERMLEIAGVLTGDILAVIDGCIKAAVPVPLGKEFKVWLSSLIEGHIDDAKQSIIASEEESLRLIAREEIEAAGTNTVTIEEVAKEAIRAEVDEWLKTKLDVELATRREQSPGLSSFSPHPMAIQAGRFLGRDRTWISDSTYNAIRNEGYRRGRQAHRVTCPEDCPKEVADAISKQAVEEHKRQVTPVMVDDYIRKQERERVLDGLKRFIGGSFEYVPVRQLSMVPIGKLSNFIDAERGV